MKKILCMAILVLFISLNTGAQLEIVNYNSQTSFKGEWIRDIFKDSDGNIWFGDNTGNSIMMFNGTSWQSYGLIPDLPDYVRAIAEDTEGNIWIGSSDGAYKFDGTSVVTRYSTTDGLPSNDIRDILLDNDGNLWFATYSGLCKYNGSTWVTYTTTQGLVSNFITTLFQDNANRIWIGTLLGVTKLHGSFINYTTADGLPDNAINSITQDLTGRIWFGTPNGAASYNETSFTIYTTADGLSSNNISQVFADSKGYLWFTSYTPNGGVTKYDGAAWPTYTTVHGLINNYTSCIEEDAEGNMWIGTGNGISKLQPEAWKHISTLDGLPNLVVFDITDGLAGRKWFATYGGLSLMTDTIINYTTANGLPDNQCNAVKIDSQGFTWVATPSGAVKITDDTLYIYNTDSGLISNNVYDIVIGEDAMWFITLGGVSKWTGNQWTNYTTSNGLASNNNFCGLLDRKGNLWVGSVDNGVSRFDGTLWVHFNTGNGFLNNVIWEIFEDDEGNIWIGTDGGLAKYNGISWNYYTTADGLPDDVVMSLEQDDYGNMWLGSDNSKITVYNGVSFNVYSAFAQLPNIRTWCIKEINDTIYAGSDIGIVTYSYKTAWTNYLKSGMPGDTIQTIFADNDDNIWLGTWGKGISKFDGKNWSNLNESGGLAGNFVYDLTQDHEGNIWVAPSSGGITKISGSTITNYKSADGLAGTGWYTITSDNDSNILIGSNAGLIIFDGINFETYTTGDGLPGNHVTAILPAKNGDLWIGTLSGNGAAKYNGSSWEIVGTTQGLVNNNVNDIIEDSKGNLWFATFAGVSKFDGAIWTNYPSNIHFENTSVWSLLEDEMGNIWASSWGKGAFIFNGRHWIRLQQADGIAGNDVWDAAMQNDGTVWLATYGKGITSVFRNTIQIDSVVSSPNICYNDSAGNIYIYAQPHEAIKYSIDQAAFASSGIFGKLTAGFYTPTITNDFDTISAATIHFENPQPVIVELGNDTTICAGNNITISAPFSWWYQWSNGISDEREIIVSEAGTYSVIVTSQAGCKGYDTITLAVQALPVVSLGDDQALGNEENLILNAGAGFASYLWSTGASDQSFVVNGASITRDTLFWVIVTDENGCIGSDSISIFDLIEDFISEENISGVYRLYPNPAHDKIMIYCEEGAKIGRIELFDTQGKLCKLLNINDVSKVFTLDIADLAAGKYIMVIHGNNGLTSCGIIKK
ncbi:MAG: two-component regulator propeller domain-containing protein [Bacteroidales bacterium]